MFLPTKTWVRSTVSHVTLVRATVYFLLVTLLHTFAAGVTQSLLFSLDARQHSFIQDIVARGDIPAQNTTFLDDNGKGGLILKICSDIPLDLKGKPYPCTTIFESGTDTGGNQVSRSLHWKQRNEVAITKAVGSPGAVILQLPSDPSIFLSHQCVQNLVQPWQRITNYRHEDIANIALQLWLLIISVFGVVNDSVPHILSAGFIRLLAAEWSVYAVWRCGHDSRRWRHIFSNSGTPCSLDIFSSYDARRFEIQLADTILSVLALVVALTLTWKLVRRYSAQAFKCVGAPANVHRINKFFLALLATLQIEVFILTCGMSMWIDVLLNTAIARISSHTPEYIGLFIASAVLLIPWITMGWYSIKKERPYWTLAFLIIGFIYIFGWSIIFYSIVYRWTFTQWPFLGCFGVASLLLLTASVALGIVCRVNFGRGHAEYLRAEENLSSLNFPQATFARDEKREAFSVIEDGQIYCVQTREMIIDDEGVSVELKPHSSHSRNQHRSSSRVEPSTNSTRKHKTSFYSSRSPDSEHRRGSEGSQDSTMKTPFDWDLDPLTSGSPRKLEPFELEEKFRVLEVDRGREERRERGEREAKLTKPEPVRFPRTNRF